MVTVQEEHAMEKLRFALFIALLSGSIALSGCNSKASDAGQTANNAAGQSAASAPSRPAPNPDHEYGVVESIYTNKSDVNAGTLIGGALGGLAGHQVGGGSGQTVTTIAGAVGGAVVGTKVANRNQVLQITVKLDDGGRKVVQQKASLADLEVGQRVRIVGRNVYPA